MQQPGGKTWNGGSQISNVGPGTTGPPRWRRPCGCVVALSVFSSDILTWSTDSLYSVQWHKIKRVHVEEYACCVNRLRQNVGLETWIWRQIVTSQTAQTKYEWPPYATECAPHENFLRTPLHGVVPIRNYFSITPDQGRTQGGLMGARAPP